MVEHQQDNVLKQIKQPYDKAIALCATMYKGGGNNSVTYIYRILEQN